MLILFECNQKYEILPTLQIAEAQAQIRVSENEQKNAAKVLELKKKDYQAAVTAKDKAAAEVENAAKFDPESESEVGIGTENIEAQELKSGIIGGNSTVEADRPEPVHTIKTTNDGNQRSFRVDISNLDSMKDVDLDISEREIILSSPFYSTSIHLTSPVLADDAKAKFIKKKKILRITLPLLDVPKLRP